MRLSSVSGINASMPALVDYCLVQLALLFIIYVVPVTAGFVVNKISHFAALETGCRGWQGYSGVCSNSDDSENVII